MIQTIPSYFNPFPVYYYNGGSPEPPGPDYSSMPVTFEAIDNNTTIAMYKDGTVNTSIQYNTGNGWQNYSFGTSITLSNIGDKVQFRNTKNTLGVNYQNYPYFRTTGHCFCYGNVHSLINNSSTLTGETFRGLFYQNSGLVDASNLILSSLTLISACYINMFCGCKSLTAAPQLPATTLADGCYESMFSGCTALSTAPYLPAPQITYSCYKNMFKGCTSLNRIAVAFTNWFSNNGTNAWVSGVAANGTFIKKDSSLPTAFGLSNIPSGWTVQLDQTVPQNIPLTFKSIGTTTVSINKGNLFYKKSTDNGWNSYSAGTVISLNDNETVSFSGTNSSIATYFSSSGTGTQFVYGNPHSLINWGALTPSCFYRLFNNNKNIVDASQLLLPATELTDSCYMQMFDSSSNTTNYLTAAPAILPATTLVNNCYHGMFAWCQYLTKGPIIAAKDGFSTGMDYMFIYDNTFSCVEAHISSSISPRSIFHNVSSDGIFIKPESTSLWQNRPSNWTVLNRDSNHVLWNTDFNGNSTTQYTGADPYADYYNNL